MRAAELAAGDPEALALIGPFRSRRGRRGGRGDRAGRAAAARPGGDVGGRDAQRRAGLRGRPGAPPRHRAADGGARHRGGGAAGGGRARGGAARVRGGRRARVRRAARRPARPRRAAAGRERAEAADLVVLCGLAGQPEVARAAELGLPVVAFDGVQGGAPIPDCSLMLPFAPDEDMGGTTAADAGRHAGLRGLAGGARDRAALLSAIRIAGPFDEHGDPVDPPVWLYRAGADWSSEPGPSALSATVGHHVRRGHRRAPGPAAAPRRGAARAHARRRRGVRPALRRGLLARSR